MKPIIFGQSTLLIGSGKTYTHIITVTKKKKIPRKLKLMHYHVEECQRYSWQMNTSMCEKHQGSFYHLFMNVEQRRHSHLTIRYSHHESYQFHAMCLILASLTSLVLRIIRHWLNILHPSSQRNGVGIL